MINNGTGTTGQATEVAEGYAALGFDTSSGTGDAERFDFPRSVVRYQAGSEAVAEYVAAQLVNGAELQEVGATYVADVIVVTGADYAGLNATLQPPPTPVGGGAGTTPADPPTTTTTYAYGEVPTEDPSEEC
jgi:hypothetical protein